MISLTLKNPLYLFAGDSTLCRDIPHPSDKQAATSSLSLDLEKKKSQAGQTLGIRLSILTNLTLTISLQKDRMVNPPIHFLTRPLKEVQSFKLLRLTISHNRSCASHISKLAEWPPKPADNWTSSIVQSPSLALLNSYPPTRPSSAA